MENKAINTKWFTFVELVIVMVIIVILTWIWFSSYVWYIAWARDTQRTSDLLQVGSSLKLYKQKRWYYWLPWDYFNITYSGTVVAMQWKLNTDVHISSIDKLPLDPKTNWFYSYSTSKNKQEYLISATLENTEINTAIVSWNYKSVSKNILPTIIFATQKPAGSNLEIQAWNWDWDINRKLFIYDKQFHNLPYTFTDYYKPYSDWTSFSDLLNEAETNNFFWQNTDYRNCIEITEAWKLIIPLDSNSFEYQIVSETGALVSTWCTL